MKMKQLVTFSKKMGFLNICWVLSFVLATPAMAAISNVNISSMIENIAATVPDLMELTTALAYLMGFFFVLNGVLHLKKYGEQKSMMSSEAHIKGPLINLCVGAALIYLPSSVAAGITTFWSDPMPYSYVTSQTDPWSEFYQACFSIIQLIGTIAFIRGLIIMSHLSGHAQSGEFGKAVAHMIGGVFCIDMYDFLQTIFTTLGISWSF